MIIDLKARCEMDKPNNCAECEHYDGMCDLAPDIWESWRTLEVRRPEWCPLEKTVTIDL